MLVLPERTPIRATKLLLPVRAEEWRQPSQRARIYGPENRTLFHVAAWSGGRHVWRGTFEDRDDADAFLFALHCGTLSIEPALWDLPTPWWEPDLGPGLTYYFSTQVIITNTAQFTWNANYDFNSANNKVECVGGGGGAGVGGAAAGGGGGGAGGGAYATASNLVVAGGASVNIQIADKATGQTASAAAGASSSTQFQFFGGGVWSVFAGGAHPGSTGADNGPGSGASGGLGGVVSYGTGSSGGIGGNGSANGGVGNADGGSGGGGAGAAGPNGVGNNGANASSTTHGGNGGSGDNGSGGAGGAGATTQGGNGSVGGAGNEFLATVGCGGGGGGGAGAASGNVAGTGANGHAYGAGGAGSGGCGANTTDSQRANAGDGQQGILVITYVPLSFIAAFHRGENDDELIRMTNVPWPTSYH